MRLKNDEKFSYWQNSNNGRWYILPPHEFFIAPNFSSVLIHPKLFGKTWEDWKTMVEEKYNGTFVDYGTFSSFYCENKTDVQKYCRDLNRSLKKELERRLGNGATIQ